MLLNFFHAFLAELALVENLGGAGIVVRCFASSLCSLALLALLALFARDDLLSLYILWVLARFDFYPLLLRFAHHIFDASRLAGLLPLGDKRINQTNPRNFFFGHYIL